VAIKTSASATVELRHPRHALQRRLSDQQQRWLASLYRRTASAVLVVCRSLLANPDDAADATQEVFLRAADSLREGLSANDARSWLLTVARSYCLDVLHGRERLDRPGANLGVDSGGETDPEAAALDRHILMAIFQELRIHERRALWQWAVERRPLAEIAHEQGRSYKAVQQFLIRARRHALAVAARVAALFGLFQLGRAARRLSQAGQMALVAVTLPVAFALLPSSSATATLHPGGAPPSQSVTDGLRDHVQGRVPGNLPSSLRVTVGVGGINPQIEVSGIPVPLPMVPREGAMSTVNNAISTVERSVRHLGSGVRVDVGPLPTPAPTGTLP
jgi:RNA polymerase sigma factor (sigma-70 family)